MEEKSQNGLQRKKGLWEECYQVFSGRGNVRTRLPNSHPVLPLLEHSAYILFRELVDWVPMEMQPYKCQAVQTETVPKKDMLPNGLDLSLPFKATLSGRGARISAHMGYFSAMK